MATQHTAPTARPSLARPALTAADAELVAVVDCALGMLIFWQAQRFDAEAAARATRAAAHQLQVARSDRGYFTAGQRREAEAKSTAARLGLTGPTYAQRRMAS